MFKNTKTPNINFWKGNYANYTNLQQKDVNTIYFIENDSIIINDLIYSNKYTHPVYTQNNTGLYKISVDELGHVSYAEKVTKEDITSLGIPSINTWRPVADNLNSNETEYALSANQGRILNEKINNKLDATGVAVSAISDNLNQNIAQNYIKDLSVTGTSITYTKGDGQTGIIITQDTDTNTWRPVIDSLDSNEKGSSLSANQGRILKEELNTKSPNTHTHSQYYNSETAHTSRTFLAAPNASDGVATFRYIHSSDIPTLNQDTAGKAGGLSVIDNRGDDRLPNYYEDHKITAFFNECIPNVHGGWSSGINVKGWTNDYASWQLFGFSSPSMHDELYFRSSISNTEWNTAKKLWHSGNFTPENYLSLSGGNISGTLFTDAEFALRFKNINENAYIAANNTSGLYIAVYGEQNSGKTINLETYDTDLKHLKNGIYYTIWDSGNFNPSSYLPGHGGDITGNLNITNDSVIKWIRNTDYAYISFKNESDGDADSYMSFITGDNGNEYFRFAGDVAGTIEEWASIKSDAIRFKGNVVYHTGNFNPNRIGGNMFIRPESGQGDPTITLAIGDNDSGINWNNDGHLSLYANGVNVANWYNSEFYVHSSLKVQGHNVYHAGNFNPGDYLPLTGGHLNGSLDLHRLYATSQGNDYNNLAIELRGNGSNDTIKPGIGFHQPGLFAGSLRQNDGANFAFYRQGGEALANIHADNFVKGGSTDAYVLLGGGGHKHYTVDPVGSTIVERDGASDINARLFKGNYQDENYMSGGLVFRVNNHIDNYLRVCNSPDAIRNWLNAASIGHIHYDLSVKGLSDWKNNFGLLYIESTMHSTDSTDSGLNGYIDSIHWGHDGGSKYKHTLYVNHSNKNELFHGSYVSGSEAFNHYKIWSTYNFNPSDYLNLSGGTLTGPINFANATWNNVGDDAQIGDCNVGGCIGIKGLNSDGAGIQFYGNSGSSRGKLFIGVDNILAFNDHTIYHSGNLTLADYLSIDRSGSINNRENEGNNQVWFDYNFGGSGLLGSAISFTGLSRYATQICGSYTHGNTLCFRTFNGDANGWNPVRSIWHDGNFNPNDKVDKISSGRPGVNKLYRRDGDDPYNVQINWENTHAGYRWKLKGYYADDFHSECHVATADHANVANTAENANTATIANSAYKIENVIASDGVGELLKVRMADNDYFRIAVGGSSNAGYAEIATCDDASEPIHVRQYSGEFAHLIRTATILDGSGNTSLPGVLNIYGNQLTLNNDNEPSLLLHRPSHYYTRIQLRQGGLDVLEGGSNDIFHYLRASAFHKYGSDNNHVLLGAGDHFALHTGRNNESNKIVRTDGNGYLQTGYINCSSGNENNNSNPDRIWGTNGSDDYMRTYRTSALNVNSAEYINTSGRLTCETNSVLSPGMRYYEIYSNGYPFTYGNLLQINGINGISQLAMQWHGNDLYYRSAPDTSTAFTDWAKIYNSHNCNNNSTDWYVAALHTNGYLNVNFNGVSCKIGPQNDSHCHYETNANTSHYFNKTVDVDGHIRVYGSGTYMDANGIHKNGSNDNYILLGGGGHKLISDFNSSQRALISDQLEACTEGNFTGGGHFVKAIRYDGWHTRLYMGYQRDDTRQNTIHVGYADTATNASYSKFLETNYDGYATDNAQVYFNSGVGLKVAMTGVATNGSSWSDTLWINGYSGGDVPYCTALHFPRNGSTEMYISSQQSTASRYGDTFRMWHSGNLHYQEVSEYFVKTSSLTHCNLTAFRIGRIVVISGNIRTASSYNTSNGVNHVMINITDPQLYPATEAAFLQLGCWAGSYQDNRGLDLMIQPNGQIRVEQEYRSGDKWYQISCSYICVERT